MRKGNVKDTVLENLKNRKWIGTAGEVALHANNGLLNL